MGAQAQEPGCRLGQARLMCVHMCTTNACVPGRPPRAVCTWLHAPAEAIRGKRARAVCRVAILGSPVCPSTCGSLHALCVRSHAQHAQRGGWHAALRGSSEQLTTAQVARGPWRCLLPGKCIAGMPKQRGRLTLLPPAHRCGPSRWQAAASVWRAQVGGCCQVAALLACTSCSAHSPKCRVRAVGRVA